jgi:protein-tyrosine phosphatase
VLARLCCVRPTSWIDLDATTNTRCVSGYRTRDGREVQPRRLIRSDTLDGLTDRDTAVLRDEHHVRQVIDLRDEEECRYETPNRLHSDGSVTLIRHRMLARAPNRGSEGSSDAARHLSTGRVVTTVLDPRLGALSTPYARLLTEVPGSAIGALRSLARGPGATLINCAAGKDRTGVVVSIALAEVGVRIEDILDDYMASATRIDAILTRLQHSPAYAKSLRDRSVASYIPRREILGELLAAINAGYGSVSHWLTNQGWTSEDHDALENKLLALGERG